MAERVRHPWETKEMRKLFDAIVSLQTRAEAERFFRDLCTLSELEAMAHRWQVARLLERGLPYLEIAERTGASTTTVTRVAHWLRHGEGGYRLALDRAGSRGAPVRRRGGGAGPAPRAVLPPARGRGPRTGAARRPRAGVPVPERARRGPARSRRGRPGI